MIYEVAGATASGRTTLARSVEREARRRALVVHNHHGGGHFIAAASRHGAAFNLTVFSRNLAALLTAQESQGTLHIFDRGVVDSLIFTRALARCGRGAPHDAAIESIVRSPCVRERLGFVSLLWAEPLVLLERERVANYGSPQSELREPLIEALVAETKAMYDELRELDVSCEMIRADSGAPLAARGEIVLDLLCAPAEDGTPSVTQ